MTTDPTWWGVVLAGIAGFVAGISIMLPLVFNRRKPDDTEDKP